MKNIFQLLLKFKHEIKYSGELVIPSHRAPELLELRVVWHMKEKYVSIFKLPRTAINEPNYLQVEPTWDEFIHKSNEFIEHEMQKLTTYTITRGANDEKHD